MDIKSYFKELSFVEKTHTYTVGKDKLKSVSGLLYYFQEQVDFDSIAGFIAKRDGKTKNQVLREWEKKKNDACELGTETHLFAELEHREPMNNKERAAQLFLDNLKLSKYEVVEKELQMYHKEKLFAGTADIIVRNKETGKYLVLDFKTNKDLFKRYKSKCLINEFNYKPDTPFSKYELQLSFYQILLEQIEGIEVEDRIIIWLKDDGSFVTYYGTDHTIELKEWLTKQTNFTIC